MKTPPGQPLLTTVHQEPSWTSLSLILNATIFILQGIWPVVSFSNFLEFTSMICVLVFHNHRTLTFITINIFSENSHSELNEEARFRKAFTTALQKSLLQSTCVDLNKKFLAHEFQSHPSLYYSVLIYSQSSFSSVWGTRLSLESN